MCFIKATYGGAKKSTVSLKYLINSFSFSLLVTSTYSYLGWTTWPGSTKHAIFSQKLGLCWWQLTGLTQLWINPIPFDLEKEANSLGLKVNTNKSKILSIADHLNFLVCINGRAANHEYMIVSVDGDIQFDEYKVQLSQHQDEGAFPCQLCLYIVFWSSWCEATLLIAAFIN